MSDTQELLQWHRAQNKADHMLHQALLEYIATVALGLFAYLTTSLFALVVSSFVMVLFALSGIHSGSNAVALRKSGYIRTAMKRFQDYPYPPIEEWTESLEERGVLTDFTDENGIYVTASDVQITDGGVKLTDDGKDKLENNNE